MKHPEFLKEGQRLVFREGRTKAVGNVTKIIPYVPAIVSKDKEKKSQNQQRQRQQGSSVRDNIVTLQQLFKLLEMLSLNESTRAASANPAWRETVTWPWPASPPQSSQRRSSPPRSRSLPSRMSPSPPPGRREMQFSNYLNNHCALELCFL